MISLSEIIFSAEVGLIYSVVSLGVYLTFRVVNFPDLTCDGSFVLGAAVSSVFINSGLSPWFGVFAAFICGMVAGSLTAILNIKFRATNLLSGILIAFMLYSINLRIMGGVPNISFGDDIIFSNFPLRDLSLIVLVIIFALSIIFMTDFGLAVRVVGENEILAKINGVPVAMVMIFSLSFSNGLIAFGGALFAQHQGFADIGNGLGTVIVALSSIMLGEKIFTSRLLSVKIFSCVIGSIIYRLLIALALYSDYIGLRTSDINLITGIMIIIVMNSSALMSYIKKYRSC